MFFHGDAEFLLYTERYHFFNRIRIKGIRHLIFYQPPNFPHFYYEMCNLMQVGTKIIPFLFYLNAYEICIIYKNKIFMNQCLFYFYDCVICRKFFIQNFLFQEANMNKKIGNVSNMTVTVLYTRYDVHQLAAIVTTERIGKMIKSDKNVHMMVTGSD